jgi:type II secretory pathway pseudopilin PulG
MRLQPALTGIRFAVATVFLLAGAIKLVAWARNVQPTGTILAEYVSETPAALALIGLGEFATGVLLLRFRRSRIVLLMGMVPCAAFSGLVMSELGRSDPRPCGCFRLQSLANTDTARLQLRTSAAFNLTLLLGITIRYAGSTKRARLRPPDSAIAARCVGMATRSGGISLIEVVVSIGIAAILTAILLPAVSTIRAQSKEAICASHLMSLGQAIAAYATTNSGWTPRGGSYTDDDYPIWTSVLTDPLFSSSASSWAELRRRTVLHCPAHPLFEDIPSGFVLNAFAFETTPPGGGDPHPFNSES